MIKTYFLDILSVVLVGIIAVLAAEKPVVDLNVRPSMADKRQPPQTKKEDTKNVAKEIARDIVASAVLNTRNIFSPDGKYPIFAPDGKSAIPGSEDGRGGSSSENPYGYTLIGILDGEERKAVFREGTGAIVILTVGKKLIDGSVITRIDNRVVEVKKGDEKRDLKIFNVKVPPLRRLSP